MKWFWKVRCYAPSGAYFHCQVETDRVLGDIDTVQDFYKALTGCKMILEGMRDSPWESIPRPDYFLKMIGEFHEYSH